MCFCLTSDKPVLLYRTTRQDLKLSLVMSSFWNVCFVTLSVFLLCYVEGQDIGTTCVVEETGQNGTCTNIKSCKYAQDLVKRRSQPTSCGFRGSASIVCCPHTDDLFESKRISLQKCEEYSKSVKKTFSVVAGAILSRTVDRCGHKYIPLVIGGESAKAAEFPHMALIGYGDSHVGWKCGGTLISEKHVLTAAHCGKTAIGPASYVRLGELDRGPEDQPARSTDFRIVSFTAHPSYSENINYDDIAIIEMEKPATFSKFIRPACLPHAENGPETKVIATGWGNLGFLAPDAVSLQKVILEKFSYSDCSKTNPTSDVLPRGIDESKMICAGSHDEVRDTCQGDSGGPLQIFHAYRYCMYEVIGVTSFGGLCGEEGKPGVYVKVFHYLDWIERIVWG